MTTPLHFATADNPLYGVYHTPPTDRPKGAVLLLNPWGWEALRAHRTLKMLASRLAGMGWASLRFDYSGTGDSWGETPPSADHWLDDVEWAIEELMALSGRRSVSLIGLRLGALVAVEVLPRCAHQVDQLVCWELPNGGDEFLEWMEDPTDRQSVAFPISEEFAAGLRNWSLDGLEAFRGRMLMLGRSVDETAPGGANNIDRVDTAGHPRCWVEDRNLGAGIVPIELIDQVVRWLTS